MQEIFQLTKPSSDQYCLWWQWHRIHISYSKFHVKCSLPCSNHRMYIFRYSWRRSSVSAIHLWVVRERVVAETSTLQYCHSRICTRSVVRKLTLHQLIVDSSICCLILRQIPRQEDHRLNRLTYHSPHAYTCGVARMKSRHLRGRSGKSQN